MCYSLRQTNELLVILIKEVQLTPVVLAFNKSEVKEQRRELFFSTSFFLIINELNLTSLSIYLGQKEMNEFSSVSC